MTAHAVAPRTEEYLLSPEPANPVFSRVLLAIDFGSASLGAARWATTYVARAADAVLTHVVPSTDSSLCTDGTPAGKQVSLRRMTPALVGGLGGFAATLGVAGYRSIVRVGPPSRCLAGIASETGSSLVVLGRRSDANRTGIGEPNVIERIARRTTSSVLVIPEGTTSAPDRIVVAVDESDFASHALDIASRLARMHEIPLTVLHVLPPTVGAYDRVIRSTKRIAAGARSRVANAQPRTAVPPSLASSTARWLVQLGRAHNVLGRDATEVAVGDPVREIARTAIEQGPSLVVVGMRGADEAPRGSVGSVARELITRGPIPVLVVNAT